MKIPYLLSQNRFLSHLRIGSAVMLIAAGAVAAILSLPLNVTGSSTPAIQVISDDAMQALSTTVGGASPLATTKTVTHWFGTTLDPDNGVTYGYNMVGADPNNCGSACDTTIPTDIIPLRVVVGGMTFDPMDSHQALAGTLASPQFALNNYGSTLYATAAGAFPNLPALIQGPGGVLSQGDAGNQLQLQDATSRAQFNKTGSSSYHVRLGTPTVHDPITITVPPAKGTLLQSGRGVIFAGVDSHWWTTVIQQLNGSLGYNDPTHLPIYLTDSVLLFSGPNCCVIGFHGAGDVPSNTLNGSQRGNGNQPVQTFAWASWIRPGIYARPNGGTDWAVQDIHALSHEISEWADDPFINNFVEPWLTPTAPQYGCSSLLETGDPVVGIGFAMGSNIYDQTPNPWTSPTNHTPSISYDGFYHPEDEVHLPWFMRLAPNTVSEPTQSPSKNIGRYTFMGDLNPFPGFRQPATGCQ
jgi:hypothetical protein